ncbi:hypothetical protein EMPS_06947 [Entomortierella parvispora]|uniref:Uncharacterized protein n=1 Tax=Entomortierella parvispora TaxID=205924 RepID=A0A9P3LXW6_9FUNG|nr:hypothetical protein EMPS_06947 [Entomortierella parvispora]
MPSNPQAFIFLTPDIVLKESKKHVKNIFDDWNLLNHIILRHEATIQQKWLKKSRDQRRNTLLYAWPQMPKKHRPDMEAFLEEGSRFYATNSDVYLWPDINQEDLLKPKILPIFLNARARHYPSVFASTDEQSFRFAQAGGIVTLGYLDGFTMMLTGQNSPSTYGKLSTTFGLKMPDRGVKPGVGLLILKAQERVYRFLVDCCLHVLQMTREAAMADATSIEPEPPALCMIDGQMHSLADVVSAAPYSVPAKLELGRLRDLVAARRSAAEDHIWSFREDPGYFENAIIEMREHRQEMLLDTHGRQHSLMAPSGWNDFWRRVIRKVILEANCFLEAWHDLLSQIDELIALQKKYEGQLKEDSPLPNELLNAFLNLDYSLVGYMKIPLTILRDVLYGSPPLRQWFDRKPEVNPLMIGVVDKPNMEKDPTLTKLLSLFNVLFIEDQRDLVGVFTVMDMIERLTQNDPKARNHFSSKIANTVADYSLLAEVRRRVKLFHPWASTFKEEADERQEMTFSYHCNHTLRMAQVEAAFKPIDISIAEPSDKKFYYPAEKRKTKENTLAMQKAEKNLDEFWDKIDRAVLKTVNNSRDGVWTSKDKKKEENHLEDLVQGLDLCSGSSTDSKKSKKKQGDMIEAQALAGTSEVVLSNDTAGETDTSKQETNHQLNFKLDKRALKVFSTLFYQPSISSQPGEIPWNDFLYAMREVGFKDQKLYGSLWHFTPTNSDMGAGIQFHEPHPVSKISFNTARLFGRRLARNYGWTSDIFVPEDPKM